MFSKRVIFFFFLGLLSLLIVLEGLTKDPSFSYKTDFSKIIELYRPIEKNQNIKIIAAYPMTLSNGSDGFPRGYQLLGQIAHRKVMVGGLDPFAPMSKETYLKISDISNPETIDALSRLGVDTIMIYDQILDNSFTVISQLKRDDRLIYIDRFAVSSDPNPYVSQNDLAKSIYVFQIKKVSEGNTSRQDVFTDADKLKIIKRDGYEIVVSISGISTGDKIYFTQPYSLDWRLYGGRNRDFTGLSYLWRRSFLEETHKVNGDYGNSWTFDVDTVRKIFDENSYMENSDGSMNVELTIFFRPRAYFYLEFLTALATLAVCLGYVGWDWLRGRKVKSNHDGQNQ